jgi:hypothetical protein
VAAFWKPGEMEIQLLLTVTTTVAGILAVFISGRESPDPQECPERSSLSSK